MAGSVASAVLTAPGSACDASNGTSTYRQSGRCRQSGKSRRASLC